MEEDSSSCSYSDDFESPETIPEKKPTENVAKSLSDKELYRAWEKPTDEEAHEVRHSLLRKRERAVKRRQKYSDEMILAKQKVADMVKECDTLRKQNLLLERKASKLVATLESSEEIIKHKGSVLVELRSSIEKKEQLIAKLREENEDIHASYRQASAEREDRYLEERQRLQSVLEKHADSKQASISVVRAECFEEAKRKEIRLDGLQATLNEHLLVVARERDQLKQKETLLDQRYSVKLMQEQERAQQLKESLEKEKVSYEKEKRELELYKHELENEKNLRFVQLKRKEGLLAVESARHDSERKLDAEKMLVLEKDNASLKVSIAELQDELKARTRETDLLKEKLLRIQVEVKASEDNVSRLTLALQEKKHIVNNCSPERRVDHDCSLMQESVPEGRDARTNALWTSPIVKEMLNFRKVRVPVPKTYESIPLARSLYDEFVRL